MSTTVSASERKAGLEFEVADLGLAEWGRRDWAEAEYADFLREIRERNDEDRWRRLPALHQLSRRGLALYAIR